MKSILITSFLSLGLVAVAFSQTQTKESKVQSLTNDDVAASPAPAQFAPSANPLKDLEKSFQALTKVKSFRVNTLSSDNKQRNLIECVYPDRFHEIAKGAEDSEVIEVGSVAYFRVPGSPWMQPPQHKEDLLAELPPETRWLLFEPFLTPLDAGAAKYIGEEQLNGQSMLVYLTKPGGVLTADPFMHKLWISPVDGLPRKFLRIDNFPDMYHSVEFSDYNADIKIELPK